MMSIHGTSVVSQGAVGVGVDDEDLCDVWDYQQAGNLKGGLSCLRRRDSWQRYQIDFVSFGGLVEMARRRGLVFWEDDVFWFWESGSFYLVQWGWRSSRIHRCYHHRGQGHLLRFCGVCWEIPLVVDVELLNAVCTHEVRVFKIVGSASFSLGECSTLESALDKILCLEDEEIGIAPQQNPRTPSLSQHTSPCLRLDLSTIPSLHSPCSSAYLRVTLLVNTPEQAGVIQTPSLCR